MRMMTWPVVALTLLILAPLMVVSTSLSGWVEHFRIEGDSEY
jgi:hypothetical protein